MIDVELILSKNEIEQVAQYAHEAKSNKDSDSQKLAKLLEAVSLCLLYQNVVYGDGDVDEDEVSLNYPPVTGEEADLWWDGKFGFNQKNYALTMDYRNASKLVREIIDLE